jgi:predicted NUDIX family NTP pyrophosphohydrolase
MMGMGRISAGLLLFRRAPAGVEVLLVHPGGPLWAKRDLGAWSIPKGEVAEGEELLAAARREFAEELGFAPAGEFLPLGAIKQKGGKTVHAWAVEGDCDAAGCKSNTFRMEWPPRSGKWAEFPEVDRAEFFSLAAAREKINTVQAPLLDQLRVLLAQTSS